MLDIALIISLTDRIKKKNNGENKVLILRSWGGEVRKREN